MTRYADEQQHGTVELLSNSADNEVIHETDSFGNPDPGR